MTARKPKHLHKPDGRPPKYKKSFNDQAFIACTEGFSDKKLAKLFGVKEQTINRWKISYPKFCECLVKGKDKYNVSKVEGSLRTRAFGYSYNEITKEPMIEKDSNGDLILDDDGKPIIKMVTSKTVRKRVHPDTRAIQFFLKNRDPERWPDKHDVNVSGDLYIELVDFCNDKKEEEED